MFRLRPVLALGAARGFFGWVLVGCGAVALVGEGTYTRYRKVRKVLLHVEVLHDALTEDSNSHLAFLSYVPKEC